MPVAINGRPPRSRKRNRHIRIAYPRPTTKGLYASHPYSHVSFGDGDFAALCGQHYHLLREYMMEHSEARAILRAID